MYVPEDIARLACPVKTSKEVVEKLCVLHIGHSWDKKLTYIYPQQLSWKAIYAKIV